MMVVVEEGAPLLELECSSSATASYSRSSLSSKAASAFEPLSSRPTK